MIRIIFRLRTAKRTICHGMKVRMNRVNAVGFVAKNDSLHAVRLFARAGVGHGHSGIRLQPGRSRAL